MAAEPATELPDEARGKAPGRGRLSGRRIVVVGAGVRPSPKDAPDKPVGNGQAISLLAAREGAAVACVDVVEEAASDTADRIRTEGGDAITVVADVSDIEASEGLLARASERLGVINGVVCNVGIGAGRGMEGTSAEDWDHTFAVNLRAHFLIAKAAMAQGSVSSIVFISSSAGIVPGSRLPAYDASKAGLVGLMRDVALEAARLGMRANVVAPGLMDTPLGRLATEGRPSRAKTPVPLRRQGTGWEVAYATVFLLSDEASYITGQSIMVDGGLTFAR